MNDLLNNFYLQKPEPAQSCLLALRSIIKAYDTGMVETVKYGMPVFILNGKIFCYLWTDKKTGEPYVLIVEGKKTNHPALVAGNRARMKTLPVNPHRDIDVETIYEVFNSVKKYYS